MIRATRLTDPLAAKPDLIAAGWSVILNGIADEAEEVSIDYRTIKRTTFFTNGKTFERTHHIPAVLERGVWKEGVQYVRGDGVSYGNQYWIAQRDPLIAEAPGTSDAWRLAVRKGQDGKDGKGSGHNQHPRQEKPVHLR
jgi:hypothetical protein